MQLRQEWLDDTVRQLQVASGLVMHTDIHYAREVLRSCALNLPKPRTHVEELILRGLLIEFASRFGDAFHGRYHREARVTCGFTAMTDLEPFWTRRRGGALESFAAWIDVYFGHFVRAHPPSPAERAARLIEEQFDRPLDVEALASKLKISRSHLVATFRARYGVAPREFQRIVRFGEALTHLRGEKIEAVALRIGYRSRKNFYSAFRKVTGLTPTEFRRLPNDHIGEIIESINLRLARAPQRRNHASR
jgi:AraC-like DNA-binding protein